MKTVSRRLWHHTNFQKLWSAETISSRSATKIIGPGLTGFLVERITAPFTVAFNGLSSLISGACLVFLLSKVNSYAQTNQ